MQRRTRRTPLAGLVALCLMPLAPASALPPPEPGAWINAEADCQAGLLVDWSLWQGDEDALQVGLATIQAAIQTGRCRTLYMYVLSDGHTICPVNGSPLPALDLADSTEALAEFIAQVEAKGVSTYAVFDLLEWHRAESALTDPLSGPLSALKALPIEGEDPTESSFASVFHPDLSDLLTHLVTAFAAEEVGFDGIVLDAHLTSQVTLGGEAADLGVLPVGPDGTARVVRTPPASREELDALNALNSQRDSAMNSLVLDLAQQAGERGDLKLGIHAAMARWRLSREAQFNLGQRWPAWLQGGPFHVALLEGDWRRDPLYATFPRMQFNMLTIDGTPAVPRPVTTLTEIHRLGLLDRQEATIEEIVIRLLPEDTQEDLLDVLARLPDDRGYVDGYPGYQPLFHALPDEVDLSLSEATPEEAVERVSGLLCASRERTPLELGPLLARELSARDVRLNMEIESESLGSVLARLCAELNGYLVRTGEEYQIQPLPDPSRLMAERVLWGWHDMAEPVALCDDAIARGVDLADSYWAKAQAQLGAWDLTAALATFEEALAWGYEAPWVLTNIGICLRGLDRFAEAEEHLALALDACPRSDPGLLSTIYLEFGRLYRKARDPESAVHALREAIRADPSHAAPYPLLAELFIEMDKHAAARETLEKALEVSPGMAEALRLLEWLDEQE